jgi:hypothetical protein
VIVWPFIILIVLEAKAVIEFPVELLGKLYPANKTEPTAVRPPIEEIEPKVPVAELTLDKELTFAILMAPPLPPDVAYVIGVKAGYALHIVIEEAKEEILATGTPFRRSVGTEFKTAQSI